MNQIESTLENRQAIVTGLAVAGFIALVAASIWLALYSTRFVPSVVNRIGAAAVYLGSVFTPANEPSLSVVPSSTASTTISFGDTSSVASSTPKTETPVSPAKPAAGTQTSGTYPISGAAATPGAPYGLPDLVVTINATGYLATSSAESFVATTTVPAGSRPAVSFTIKNVGTNVSGAWRFSASIPAQTSYVYQSQLQQALSPGDSIDYTLGFDQANKGSGRTITIIANPDHIVAESTEANNTATASLTILGS